MTNENEQGERVRAVQQIADLGQDLIKVLHVEDDPNCREAIADQLSDYGFVVRSFADAMSLASGLAASSEADIILLDWDLPGVSGIELFVDLRRCGVKLPVVFLTGYGFTPMKNSRSRQGPSISSTKLGALRFWPVVCGVWSGRRNRQLLHPLPDPWSVASSS